VGGQWQKGTNYPLELRIVTNTQLPDVKVEAQITRIS
jgi:hypothetical protein